MDSLDAQDRLIMVVVLSALMLFVIFFELRVMKSKSKEVKRASQKKDEAFNSIITTRSVVNVMRRNGADTSNSETLIASAKKSLDRGEYDRCMDLCEEARSQLTNPTKRPSQSPAATGAGDKDRLEKVAESILSSRAAPAPADSYKGAKLSSDQDGNYLSAKFELNTAKSDFGKAMASGVDVAQAQVLLTEAEAAFSTGNFTKALSLAIKVRKAVSSEVAGETIRLRASEEVLEPEAEPTAEEMSAPSEMLCGKCSASLDSDDEFCAKCGTKVLKERMCGVCGTKPKATDLFCRKCGARID